MTKQKHYSIQQLSKETNIPASSVRYYKKEYSTYFAYTRLEGSKYPVYDSECIEVLKTIRKALKLDKTKHEVIEELDNKFTPIINIETDGSTKPQHNNKQPSNKEIATTEKPSVSVMQTLKQMSYFNENQLQLTEYYKKQSEQQREIIEELTILTTSQKKLIEELEKELDKLEKPSLFNKIFKK
jgi:DNA-binding transcriptional MerR regulator